MGITELHTYDSINWKWKSLLGKVSNFFATYDNVVRMNESRANDEVILQKAIHEYQAAHRMKFTFLHAWRTLKHHIKWIEDNYDDDEDDEKNVVQETRPIGWDKAKKKAVSWIVPSVSSVVGEPLVNMLMER
ncbi:hypothetical protein Tco_1012653 [Tanacetum coccineum]